MPKRRARSSVSSPHSRPRFVAALVAIGLAVVCLAAASCARTVSPAAASRAEAEALAAKAAALDARARAIAAAMSDEELVGQALMVGVDGVTRLSSASRAILEELRPGAALLFGYNVSPDPRTVASLAADIRSAASVGGIPPFVAIDHEGGSVYRFKGGLSRLPSAEAMGRSGEAAARAAGAASGSELSAVGLTMNMAPVVEASTDGNRAFLSDRAWSGDPVAAGGLSAAYLEACQANGTATVAKHFPGNAAADPHRALPVLAASREVVDRLYLEPFRLAIRSGVSAVMLSHALVPAIDQELPVSLSPPAIKLLKEGLGFDGIVLTDDLQMAALSGLGGHRAVAVAALKAGADLLMVSGGRAALEARDALLAALRDGRLPRARLEDAAARVVRQKLRFGLDTETDESRAARLASLDATVSANRAALAAAMAGAE